MNPSVTSFYALRLRCADSGQPRRLAGRLEHVLSGRCREFDGADALLACLAEEAGATDAKARGGLRADGPADAGVPSGAR